MNKIVLFFLLSCHLSLYAQDSLINERDSNLVKSLFFDGLREKLAENYVNASANFIKVIAVDPKNDAAYFEIASLNYRRHKLAEAELAVKQAIELRPDNPWYYKLQAEIYKQNGNMEALAEVFDKLINLSPETEDYYFDKANALFRAGKIANAQKVYARIEEKFGDSPELASARQNISLHNNTTLSAAEIDKMLEANPSDIKNYLSVSRLLLIQHKSEEAIKLLQKAKLLAPNNYEVDLALAGAYQAQRKNELAIGPLKTAFAYPEMPVNQKIEIVSTMLPRFNNQTVVKDANDLMHIALKIHPSETKLLLLYGDVLYQQGNLKGAREQYQTILKTTEQVYPAWEKLLAIQTLMGLYTDAIKTGEAALNIYPNQAILYYYQAFALHRDGQNAAAGMAIKSALQLDGDDTELKAMIFALQAEVLVDQQKFKEADAAFDKSIALAPQNYLTMSNFAYYLALRSHDLKKAEMLSAKAAAALPKHASIADTYAFVLFKSGQYGPAKIWIEKALGNNEANNPVYLEHYGDILFLKGEKELALIQWQKARAAGNGSDKLKKKIDEKKYFK